MVFECHITIADSLSHTHVNIKQSVLDAKWKFSCIDGDPLLGKQILYYATRWFEHRENAIIETNRQKDLFIQHGLRVVRAKVEEVIYDARLIGGMWKEIP